MRSMLLVNIRPGTHYPHVTWAHVMLQVQLGYLTLNSGAHSHFCHSDYVAWSDAELRSAHMPARLLNLCWRTRRSRLTKCVRQQKFKRRAGMWADQSSASDHVTQAEWQKCECAPEFNVKYPNCTRNFTWAHVTWGQCVPGFSLHSYSINAAVL
jgi:hypothetical protein